MGLDHNLLSILTAMVLVVLGIIGFLISGWFRHVNANLVEITAELKKEAEARERRWADLHRECTFHAERIAKLEGRLNGKAKLLSALRIDGEDE